jgi:hypothetical protein
MATLTEGTDETSYPESWLWSEHGDLVAGTFLRFDEGMTKEYGAKVIAVLVVDGAERGIWLTQQALHSKFGMS